MIEKDGLLIIICDFCKNPVQIPYHLENDLLKNDMIDCPDCEESNIITEELRTYARRTRVK